MFSKISHTPIKEQTAKPFFQAKLTINEPGDTYEQEADAVADKVMRMPTPSVSGDKMQLKPMPFSQISRTCAACDKENQEVNHTRNLIHAADGKKSCSPTWFGDTSPEIDTETGGFTGKLIVKYNDAELKDTCVRECVALHEGVHVKDLTPIVKKIHACDVAAGKDWNKKEKCNEMSNTEFNSAVVKKSECRAYGKSYACLKQKLQESKGKCSKPEHKKELQKHLEYEACEKKKVCDDTETSKSKLK